MVELIAENRKARADFKVFETYEAGIVLTGAEIKSIRLKRVSLRGSFVKIVGGEAYVLNLKIDRYPYSGETDYSPKRTRKLLMGKREIARLAGLSSQKGVTIVPLKLYLRHNLAKLQIGVGRAKRKYDKRRALKEKDLERQVERELKER
jgi:SsrA-binding protein